MTRRSTHLDAMLRNLGAAYYRTTQGTARAADVTRALESVAEEDQDALASAGATIHHLLGRADLAAQARFDVADQSRADVIEPG